MLHELLLALRGHCGGLFTERDGNIKVVSVPFLHPGEESLLNILCEHGTYYKRFMDFIRRATSMRANEGLYLKAFCSSLQAVLSSYEHCIVHLEQEILLDSDMSLTSIQTALQEYTLLFPSISNLLDELEKRKVRGCQLLDLMFKHMATGIPSVKQAVQTLMFGLHRVMYKQLSSWLLHGVLVDDYGEFFVHKVGRAAAVAVVPTTQEEEMGIGGLSGEQLRQIQGLESDISEKGPDAAEHFSVRADMLPQYLPTRLLNKILFIGESVDMFENSDKLVANKSILRHKVQEFSVALTKLSMKPTFNLVDLENTIDVIRACVAERLWEYVIEESQLLDVLHRVKDMYLLGRGDIFLSLITALEVHLSVPPSSSTPHDINRVFQQLLRTLNVNDDRLQAFKLAVDKLAEASKGQSRVKGWNSLSLEYKPEWPLHVFFTPGALERYNSIFRFLLAVKRVHASLHCTWKSPMALTADNSDAEHMQIYQLRNHMLFLVDNLQYYLQVDVIESQFSTLIEKFQSSRDFEVIRLAHESFLLSLLSQCFLLNVSVNHCLMCILEGASSFCALINSSDDSLSKEQWEHIANLQSMFRKQTLLLFKILSSSKTHHGNPYLVQLLLRIDFNKFFSSTGQQLG